MDIDGQTAIVHQQAERACRVTGTPACREEMRMSLCPSPLFMYECVQVVIAKYTARLTDELTLAIGESVLVQQAPEGGWWFGSCAGHEGWFPSSHVTHGSVYVCCPPCIILSMCPSAQTPRKLSTIEIEQARFCVCQPSSWWPSHAPQRTIVAFTARYDDELSFEAGEEILVLQVRSSLAFFSPF
jgi:hypothetical protein